MSERKKEVRYIAVKFANAILADYSSYIISPDGLQAINAFLDELLFILIDSARSLDMHRIKSAIYQTFPQALGKNAIVEAELEAKSYLEMGGKDVPKDRDTMASHSYFDLDSDVEQVFEQFRAKCQYYSKLGERLGSPAGSPGISINIPTLLAIYVTAVLEHIAEYVLLISSSIADRQDHADMVTAKEVYMGLLEDRQTETVFEIMVLKTQLQKRFYRQSLLVMNPNEPAQVKRSGSWGKQLRLGNADKPKIDVQLPMEIEDDPVDPNRPQFGDWDDDDDEESRRKKKTEFEQLISSGETMKVSLTPNRLRTIEVHRKAGGGGGVASRSSSRAASVFGGKHGRRPSHGERPAPNGRKNSQLDASAPSTTEPAVPAIPSMPSLGAGQPINKKQANGHTIAALPVPTPPASVRGMPSQQQQQSQPMHGLGITKDGRATGQDELFSTPFPIPPSHAANGSASSVSILGATPPASPNGPEKQVPPPLNLAESRFGRTSSSNSVISNNSQNGSTGGGRSSGPEAPMTPVSESGSVKRDNPLKSFMGRLGRNSMSRDSMEQQSAMSSNNSTASPTSIRSFTIGGPGLSTQGPVVTAASATSASHHSSHHRHGSHNGSAAGSIQSNISSSSSTTWQHQPASSIDRKESYGTPLSSSAVTNETINGQSASQQHHPRSMSPNRLPSIHQRPISPTLGGPVAIPSRNASLGQEIISPVSATFSSFNAATGAAAPPPPAPPSSSTLPAPVSESSRSGSPRGLPTPPSHPQPLPPLPSSSQQQYPNKPIVPERTTSSPTIQPPASKVAPSHVPWTPYTPVITPQSRASSFAASSVSGGVGGGGVSTGTMVPAGGTLRANPFVQADALKRESSPSPKLHPFGNSTPPALNEKSPVREAMRAATASSPATTAAKEPVTPPTPNTPGMDSTATIVATAAAVTSSPSSSVLSATQDKFTTGQQTDKQQEAETTANVAMPMAKKRSSVSSVNGSFNRQYHIYDATLSATSPTSSSDSPVSTKKPTDILKSSVDEADDERDLHDDVDDDEDEEDDQEQLKSDKERKAAAIAAAAVAAGAAAASRSGRSSIEPALVSPQMPMVMKRQSIFVDEEAQAMDRLSTQRHRQSMHLDPDVEYDEEDEDDDLDFLTEDDLISGYGQPTAPPPEKWHYTSDEDEEDDEDEEYEDAQGEVRRRRHESFMSAKSSILPTGSTTSLPLRTDDEDDEDDEDEEEEEEAETAGGKKKGLIDADKDTIAGSATYANTEADAEVLATLNKAQAATSANIEVDETSMAQNDVDTDDEPLDFAAPDQGDMLPSQMKAAMMAAAFNHSTTSWVNATTTSSASSNDTMTMSVDSSTSTATSTVPEDNETNASTIQVATLTLAEQAIKLREERKAARDARRLAKQEERRRRKQAELQDGNRPPSPSTPTPTTQMIPLTPTDLVLIRQKVFSSGNFEASMRMLDTIFHAAMAKMVEGRERGVQTDPVLFADEVDDTSSDEDDMIDEDGHVRHLQVQHQPHHKAIKKKRSVLRVSQSKPSAWVAEAVEQQEHKTAPAAADDDDDEDRVVEWLLGGV